MPDQALSGLKVVGFVEAGVGPLTLKGLATHGATVVVIESEKRPHMNRVSGPFKDDVPGLNRSYSYAFTNSDRYDMLLDLKHPRAGEVTRRLAGWADVFVDNWRPGVMEEWGLSYQKVSAINPRIVMVSLSHEGHTGPHRTVAGAGAILSGYCGMIHLTGWPDRPPVTLGARGILPDLVSPRFGAAAILAALDYRRRTGKGQYVDISEYEVAIQFLSPAIVDYTANKRVMNRDGNKCPYAAPHGVYRCKGDDKWCAIAVFTDSEWEAFCTVIGKPAWTEEARFATLGGRKDHEAELNELVEEWTAGRTAEEVMTAMQRAGVEAGAVRGTGEAVEDCPQSAHRHHWWTLEHPEMGKTIYEGSPYLLSKTPYRLQRPAPCFGEHTEYVCTKLLGMRDGEFIELYREGVFS